MVKAIREDGYTISHKGYLCWMPFANKLSDVLPARVLIRGLEGLFTVLVWAFENHHRNYGTPSLCPWSLDTMEYDGLCSHTTFKEGLPGEAEGLTHEQVDVEFIERKKTKQKQAIKKAVIDKASKR